MTPLKPCVFPHQHFFLTEFFCSEVNQVAVIPCLFGLCSSCGNAAIFYYFFFFFYQGVPTQPQIASLAFLEYIFTQSVCLFKQKSSRVSVILLNKERFLNKNLQISIQICAKPSYFARLLERK